MKKIFFNDKYDLTQAVLEGRKTMMRRIFPYEVHPFDTKEDLLKYSRYKIGEVVAIAQAYKDISYEYYERGREFNKIRSSLIRLLLGKKGWNNKMFVESKFMLHHIKITDIKVERLQDIPNEDCLKEGVYHCETCYESIHLRIEGKYHFKDCGYCFKTPREAFARLIDKVSRKGTWESNPWVFAYEFELID